MSSPAPAPHGEGPLSGEIQFEKAEVLPVPGNGPQCVLCKQYIAKTYYHARGHTVCEACAQRIQAGQQKPPVTSLSRAFLYGAGAALGGCTLYALVAILTGLEIGLIAIVVGVMVGKAVRHGSNGLGGRPQQILAVVLTYFAISTSYIPVFVYHAIKDPSVLEQAKTDSKEGPAVTGKKPAMSPVAAIVMVLLLAAAAPFFGLSSGVGGFLTLFIIYIGLQRAWKLTARSDILIMGPYEVESPA
jgi:hypothetical protein